MFLNPILKFLFIVPHKFFANYLLFWEGVTQINVPFVFFLFSFELFIMTITSC